MVVDVIFRRRLREQEQQQRLLHQVLRQQRPEHLQDDRSSSSSRNTNGGGGGGRLWWWWSNAPAAAAPPGSPPQVTSAASFARGSRRSNRSLLFTKFFNWWCFPCTKVLRWYFRCTLIDRLITVMVLLVLSHLLRFYISRRIVEVKGLEHAAQLKREQYNRQRIDWKTHAYVAGGKSRFRQLLSYTSTIAVDSKRTSLPPAALVSSSDPINVLGVLSKETNRASRIASTLRTVNIEWRERLAAPSCSVAFFHHIPKTAGTLVRSMLMRNVGADARAFPASVDLQAGGGKVLSAAAPFEYYYINVANGSSLQQSMPWLVLVNELMSQSEAHASTRRHPRILVELEYGGVSAISDDGYGDAEKHLLPFVSALKHWHAKEHTGCTITLSTILRPPRDSLLSYFGYFVPHEETDSSATGHIPLAKHPYSLCGWVIPTDFMCRQLVGQGWDRAHAVTESDACAWQLRANQSRRSGGGGSRHHPMHLLEAYDVIGTSDAVEAFLVLLADRVGLPYAMPAIGGKASNRGTFIAYAKLYLNIRPMLLSHGEKNDQLDKELEEVRAIDEWSKILLISSRSVKKGTLDTYQGTTWNFGTANHTDWVYAAITLLNTKETKTSNRPGTHLVFVTPSGTWMKVSADKMQRTKALHLLSTLRYRALLGTSQESTCQPSAIVARLRNRTTFDEKLVATARWQTRFLAQVASLHQQHPQGTPRAAIHHPPPALTLTNRLGKLHKAIRTGTEAQPHQTNTIPGRATGGLACVHCVPWGSRRRNFALRLDGIHRNLRGEILASPLDREKAALQKSVDLVLAGAGQGMEVSGAWFNTFFADMYVPDNDVLSMIRQIATSVNRSAKIDYQQKHNRTGDEEIERMRILKLQGERIPWILVPQSVRIWYAIRRKATSGPLADEHQLAKLLGGDASKYRNHPLFCLQGECLVPCFITCQLYVVPPLASPWQDRSHAEPQIVGVCPGAPCDGDDVHVIDGHFFGSYSDNLNQSPSSHHEIKKGKRKTSRWMNTVS